MPERDHVDARGPLVGDVALQLGEEVRRDPLEAARTLSCRPPQAAANSCELPVDRLGPAGQRDIELVADVDGQLPAVERDGRPAAARRAGPPRPRRLRRRSPR